MQIHLPTLLASAALLLWVSSTATLLFGLAQRVHRGYFCWVAASWLATGGVTMLSLAEPARAWLAHLVLLPWPLLTLAGLRRFHARDRLPGRPVGDAALLAAAAGAAAALAASRPAWAVPAFAAAGALLHGHSAAVAWACPARRDSVALRALVMTLAAAALGLAAAAWLGWRAPAALGLDLRLAAGLLVVPGALLMLVLAMQFTHERTERELRDSRRRLRFLANIDMLTRVPNRRRFEELARRALQSAAGPAAMLMFDIDHFKRINDVLGHAAGDRALRLVARSVQQTLRTQDVAGRHGGDEFVLLLPGTSQLDAMVVAARIAAQVQARAEQESLPQLSLSFGVVQAMPGESVDEALHHADQALYEAKRQGRSRIVAARGGNGQAVFDESRPLGLSPSRHAGPHNPAFTTCP